MNSSLYHLQPNHNNHSSLIFPLYRTPQSSATTFLCLFYSLFSYLHLSATLSSLLVGQETSRSLLGPGLHEHGLTGQDIHDVCSTSYSGVNFPQPSPPQCLQLPCDKFCPTSLWEEEDRAWGWSDSCGSSCFFTILLRDLL